MYNVDEIYHRNLKTQKHKKDANKKKFVKLIYKILGHDKP